MVTLPTGVILERPPAVGWLQRVFSKRAPTVTPERPDPYRAQVDALEANADAFRLLLDRRAKDLALR